MSIKHHFVRLAEKITGRKCCRCVHCKGGKCAHPYEGAYAKCWQTLTRPGFEKRPPRYLRTTDTLTAEEQHQLHCIQAALADAAETAKEGGLLDEPAKAPTIARLDTFWDDRAESGLLEEE